MKHKKPTDMTNRLLLKPLMAATVPLALVFVMGNVQAITYSAKFDYDIAAGIVTKTDPDSRTLVYKYDVVNRLDKLEFTSQSPLEVIDYRYGLTDKLEEVIYPAGRQVFGYDSLDRVISITDHGVSPALLTQFRYDHKDRVTWITYPDSSKVCYEYDPDSRITRVGRGKSDASMDAPCAQAAIDKIDYAYDSRGRLSTLSRANGVVSFIEYYDETGLARVAGHKKTSGELIYSDRYVYFPNTNLYRTIIRTTPQGMQATKYTYDAYKRLETVKEPSGRMTTFTYDAFGNRQLETISCPADYTPNTGEKACGTYRYDYTAQSNRLERIHFDDELIESFSYNKSGRMTQRTKNGNQITRYVYDDRGLLTQVTHPDGGTVEFTYDGLGVRKSKTINGSATTYYVTASLFGFSRVLMEVNPGSNNAPLRSYAYGGHSQVISETAGERDYLLHEGTVGSVSHVADETGLVTAQYNYDAFGMPLNDAPSRFGYTGEQYDQETGLLYLRARYYDPALGRFISADPFWGRLEDPVSQNRFIYVHNNPLLYTDPSGLDIYVGQRPAFVNKDFNPFNHAAIVLRPNNPSDFIDDPLFSHSNGAEATLGGQAFGDGGNLTFGALYFAPNYSGDNTSNLSDLTLIPTPPGMTDSEHILSYINTAYSYDNQASYDPLITGNTILGEHYNSNGLISGLITANGDVVPNMPGIRPGWNDPLPLTVNSGVCMAP